MNEFLIQLQAILDKETSKGNIDKSIERIQNQINKLKIQAEIDPKLIITLKKQLEKITNQKIDLSNINIDTPKINKVGKQAGEQVGKQLGQGISNGLKDNTNILESFKKSLENMKMGSKDIETVVNTINELGISINSLKQSKNNKGILSVEVSGIDKAGQAIKVIESFERENGKLLKSISSVSTAHQKQSSEIDKYYTNYANRLSSLQTKYAKASIDYSSFEKDLEKFKNGEVTINELSKSFNTLENAAKRGIQSLKSQTSSFDPITQAINNMRDLPSMLQKLEAGMNGVKDQTSLADVVIEDLYKDYQSLQNIMSNNGGKVPLTEEWTSKYQNLMSTVASATKQVEALKKAEASDNSQTTRQANYYSEILSNYRQIYSLKKKLLAAGKEESKVIENQIRSLKNANTENYKQLNNQGLSDKSWQDEVKTLKKKLDYAYQISIARQNDKNTAKEQSQITKEQIQSEKERLALLESQKQALAVHAKEKAKTTAQQEANQQKEINSILSRQQNAYKEIWNIKKQTATLDPNQNENQLSALNEKKKFYQEIFLAAQKELQAYNNISISQEHLNSLSEIRKRTESEIAVAVAKQTELKANKIQFQIDTGGYESKVQSLVSRTMQWTDGNGNARISTDALKQSLDKLTAASAAYASNKTEETQRRLIEADKELDKQIKTVTNSVRKMNAELAKDTTVSSLHNKIQSFYDNNSAAHGRWGAQLKKMLSETASGAKLTTQRVREIEQSFNGVTIAARQAGKVGKSWLQSLKESTKYFAYFASPTFITMKAISEIKQGVNAVKELDTALVDLKKTTTMTSSQLEQFDYDSNNTAKQMGVATSEIIDQASAWSRLGYSSAEAATQMAKYSSHFKSISPGMNIDEATTSLVSIMKAYDIDVNNVLDGIMSKINDIGNKFGTSNTEIAEGLKKSSAAMAAVGSSLEDNIALFTAGQEIVQDASQVGNAIRSIALRIRGYDEETEQLSEDLIDVTGKVANLTKVASNGGHGISLFTDVSQTEYKSLVTYLGEISDIWDELDQKSQNELLDKLFGKNRAQVGAAIIKNFDTVRSSIEAMTNSAGSADREMNVIMDGLDYKLNRLKETGTGIAQNLFERDEMKSIVDGFTSFLEVIDTLTSKIGLLGTIGLGTGLFAGIKNVGRDKMYSLICYLF